MADSSLFPFSAFQMLMQTESYPLPSHLLLTHPSPVEAVLEPQKCEDAKKRPWEGLLLRYWKFCFSPLKIFPFSVISYQYMNIDAARHSLMSEEYFPIGRGSFSITVKHSLSWKLMLGNINVGLLWTMKLLCIYWVKLLRWMDDLILWKRECLRYSGGVNPTSCLVFRANWTLSIIWNS